MPMGVLNLQTSAVGLFDFVLFKFTLQKEPDDGRGALKTLDILLRNNARSNDVFKIPRSVPIYAI